MPLPPLARKLKQPKEKVTRLPVICRLSKESLSEIVRIENEGSIRPWSQSLIATEFEKPQALIYGARLNGNLVGFLISHVVVDEAHILNIVITPSSQGQGIGRNLLDYALEEFYEKAVRNVFLEMRNSNDKARALYESLGFLETSIRKGYYRDEDAVVMQLDIDHFKHCKNHILNAGII